MSRSREETISKDKDIGDWILRRSKTILPTLGRVCLVSTFIEDGIRMLYQWSEQRDHMSSSWGCGTFSGTLFVMMNLFGQLIGSSLVIIRFYVPAACAVLFGIVVLQTFAYSILWDINFILRNMSLCGLLLADARSEAKSLFAGVSLFGDNKPKTYMQLTARILLVFMFITVLRLELNPIRVIENVFALVLIVAVTVGYKAKLSALLLVLWLTVLNLYLNTWWTIPSHNPIRDILKYDFFQTLSVIGGLLMVVSIGPGDVSMDKHKKDDK